jgi:hypothetical protein
VSLITRGNAYLWGSYLQALNDVGVVRYDRVGGTQVAIAVYAVLLFLVSILPELYWRGRAIAETWQPSWL